MARGPRGSQIRRVCQRVASQARFRSHVASERSRRTCTGSQVSRPPSVVRPTRSGTSHCGPRHSEQVSRSRRITHICDVTPVGAAASESGAQTATYGRRAAALGCWRFAADACTTSARRGPAPQTIAKRGGSDPGQRIVRGGLRRGRRRESTGGPAGASLAEVSAIAAGSGCVRSDAVHSDRGGGVREPEGRRRAKRARGAPAHLGVYAGQKSIAPAACSPVALLAGRSPRR